MISGIVFILAGESLLLLSWPHGQWALIVLVINSIYIPLLEEPPLVERFGDSYREVLPARAPDSSATASLDRRRARGVGPNTVSRQELTERE